MTDSTNCVRHFNAAAVDLGWAAEHARTPLQSLRGPCPQDEEQPQAICHGLCAHELHILPKDAGVGGVSILL